MNKLNEYQQKSSITKCRNVSPLSGCYAFLEGGEIIYVGASQNLSERMRTRCYGGDYYATGCTFGDMQNYPHIKYHKVRKDSEVLFWFDDDYKALESYLIKSVRPKFNKVIPKIPAYEYLANKCRKIYYAWLDSQKIKLVPEFEYDFNCNGWAE